jgi:hypothetical protein
MVLILVASVFFVAVYGQASDPTKACLPDVLQVHTNSLVHNVSGIAVFDFPGKKSATRMSNGARTVIDLASNTLTTINENSGSCVSSPLPAGFHAIASQCLPASAKLLTPPHTTLGLSLNSVEIEGWEYTVANFGTVRVAVTKASPGVLVLGQIDSPNAALSDIQIFVNPKTSIDDSTIFDVPEDCGAAAAVG